MRLLLLCLTVVSLTVGGCAIPPDAFLTPQQSYVRDIGLQTESMKQALDSNRALDPIRGKIALFDPDKETTFEMLANRSKPTTKEQTAILEYAKLREAASAQRDAIDTKYHFVNPVRRINEARSQAVNELLADLYNRALTYGDFAKKRREVNAIAAEAIDRLRSELVAEERARQEQASIERLSRAVVAQQRRQPLGTTCSFVGKTMYCH